MTAVTFGQGKRNGTMASPAKLTLQDRKHIYLCGTCLGFENPLVTVTAFQPLRMWPVWKQDMGHVTRFCESDNRIKCFKLTALG